MRIVHVDETFHPAFGYQANPLAKFQSRQGNEVIIVAPTKEYMYPVYKEFGDDGSRLKEQDATYSNSTGVKIVRVPAKGYFMRRLVYGRDIFQVVDDLNPDVVFVHCVETLTAMRFLIKRKKYPMMFDSHMLSMASDNKLAKVYEFIFRHLITRIIIKNKYDVIRTQDDRYVNDHLGIPEEQTPFISFGTDTLLFCPSKEAREMFRKDNDISLDEFVVVYTGKLTEAKGGKLLAETFKEKFEMPVTLVCVGTPPNNEYGDAVQNILNSSENRIIMYPTQNYLDLAKFYQMADICVFPKQCSMSFYDAEACGTPVLSENNSVNVDRCRHNNGLNFDAGNVEDFREKIMYFASISKEEREQYRKNARHYIENGFDYEEIAQKYTMYLEKAVKKYKLEKK